MKIEIVIEEITANKKEVDIKGWSKSPRLYSSVSLPSDIDIPKLGSVMVLDVSFRQLKRNEENELVSSPTEE